MWPREAWPCFFCATGGGNCGARERALFLSPGFFPAGFRVYVAWSARQTLCVQVGAGFHGINHFVFYSMTRAHLPMVTGKPCPRLVDSVPAGKNKVTTDTQHLEGVIMDRDLALLKERVDEFITKLDSLVQSDCLEELSEYLDDCWDIEVTFNMQGEFNGFSLAVALGGPNIYISYHRCQAVATISGSWGTINYQDCLGADVSDALWDAGEHLAEQATYAIERRSRNPWSHVA